MLNAIDRHSRYGRTFIGCRHCKRPLTAAEIIERFCEECASATEPTEIRDGGRA